MSCCIESRAAVSTAGLAKSVSLRVPPTHDAAPDRNAPAA
jgi:hypothetical protein